MTEVVVAVIDADVIAYKAAAANEKRTIVATHVASGRKKEFKNRTEFKGFLDGTKFGLEDFVLQDIQTPESLSFALHTVKCMTETICNGVGTRNYQLVLSGKENFRLSIPLPKQYKSGRDDNIRPIQLSEVRDYMLKFQGAVLAPEGVEADDDLASRKWKGYKDAQAGKKVKVVACTIDKDDLGCMGWSYNWDKMTTPLYIDGLGELHMEGTKVKGTGRIWLYCQSVYGDPVDTYKPVDIANQLATKNNTKKVMFGDKMAYNLLKDCKTDKQCWEAIYNQYLAWYPDVTYYTDWEGIEQAKDAVDIWQMYMDCAHMRRWQDDRIDVRKVLTNYGFI